MKNNAYLLYRPEMGHEESITPYAVFSTKEEAEKALTYIREWGTKVFNGMPDHYNNYESNSTDYNEAFDARANYCRTLIAPFGVDMGIDLNMFTTYFSPSCVAIMPLPLNPDMNSEAGKP